MSILVLDLDDTVWIRDEHAKDLNRHNHLSKSGHVLLNDIPTPLRLINVDRLTALINYACEKHDGVMFLTAGFWDPDGTRHYLYSALQEGLSEKAQKMLANAPIITPTNSTHLHPGRTPFLIRLLSKNERLQAWLKHARHKIFSERAFYVVVDDNTDHLKSFQQNRRVTTIHATTLIPDMEEDEALRFYQDAATALDDCTRKEQKASALRSGRSTSLFQKPVSEAASSSSSSVPVYETPISPETAGLTETVEKSGALQIPFH